MNRRACSLLFSAVLVFPAAFHATPALAQGADTVSAVPESGPVLPYLRTHFELRKQLDKGRGYRSLDDEERVRLFQAQDRLFGLLGPIRNFEDLDSTQREQLTDIQIELVAILALADEHEILCRRGRSIGSRIPENECATRASLARLERQTRREYDEIHGIGR
jgi:hypothetical protein